MLKDKEPKKKGMSIYDDLMSKIPEAMDDDNSEEMLIVKKDKKKKKDQVYG